MRMSALVAISLVCLPALAQEVALRALMSQFGPSELGGIRTVLRYAIARPDREETDYLLLGESAGDGKSPVQIQVQGPHGDDIVLSDVDGADCTLARTSILRHGAEVVLLWAVRVFDPEKTMAGGNALPGPMDINVFRRNEGGNPGESSPLFKADASPIRTGPVCSLTEVQAALDHAASTMFPARPGR